VCLLESIETGTLFVIANTHIYWNPEYTDVKLVQVSLLIEEIEKFMNGNEPKAQGETTLVIAS
jgi:CCR4-NOT transcription complex subunit 6